MPKRTTAFGTVKRAKVTAPLPIEAMFTRDSTMLSYGSPNRARARAEPAMTQNPPFPSPEELKAKLSEFMKTNFGDKVAFTTYTEPETAEAPAEEKPRIEDGEPFVFNFLPRDIKAHLDRFVIKQDEAKKVLAIAVCDHYNNVKYMRAAAATRDTAQPAETEYAKQNVILIGPTGVGKTYLIKHIADLIG